MPLTESRSMKSALAATLSIFSAHAIAQSVPMPDLVSVTKQAGPSEVSCLHEPYPKAAAQAGVVGTTILSFSLDADGYLDHTMLIKSAGTSREHKLLDAAAVRMLWSCTFYRPDVPGAIVQATYTWKPLPARAPAKKM